MQYIQSNTSTQAVNISSLRRSADGTPTIRRRSADLPHLVRKFEVGAQKLVPNFKQIQHKNM